MCILFLAVDQSPLHPLVLASNRDEFTARATQPPGLGTAFPDALPRVIAGKDLCAGGTWAAADTRTGRTATILNVAPSVAMPPGSPSRGALPLLWINAPEDATPLSFLDSLLSGDNALMYAGFSLVVSSVQPGTTSLSCAVGTNAYKQVWGNTHIQDLSTPGVYALTNDGNVLDTVAAASALTLKSYWPKARRGYALMTQIFANKQKMRDLDMLVSELLSTLLGCKQVEDEHSVIGGSVGGEGKTAGEEGESGRRAWENHVSSARKLTSPAEVPIFLSWGEYATRTSTVLVFTRGGGVDGENGRGSGAPLRLHYMDQGFDGNGDGERLRLGPFPLELQQSLL
jgi:uncharacterized protein with NRDE domain